MDKMAKLDYMQSIETYLNENQVYELFEELLKQVIVSRPENPLQFILSKIKANRSKFQFDYVSLQLMSNFKNAPSNPPQFININTIYFYLDRQENILDGRSRQLQTREPRGTL